MPTKYIALVRRAERISEDKCDLWDEAFSVETGETVESLANRVKKRIGHTPDTIRILPIQAGV